MIVFSRIILIFSIATIGLAGCGGDDPGASGRTTVVAAVSPLAHAAQEIGGDAVDVSAVAPPGAEPHDVELTPRDVERLQDADLVLYAGSGFQPAVEDAVAGSANAVDVLEVADAVPGDPHVWLDPIRFAAVAREIGERLDADAGAEAFVARLEEIDAAYEAGLADCANRVIVTAHSAFGYLAERYRLRQVALAGVAPEAEPSARELELLADEVSRAGGLAVFAEPRQPRRVAETVARLARVAVHELDPIETLVDGDDYITVMRRNLDTLRSTLGCR